MASSDRATYWLRGQAFAHRGLHRAGGPGPENTLAAVRAAIHAGFGIEIDVRPAKDGAVMMFHDETLTRLCGRDDYICALSSRELSAISIAETDQTIAKLSDVLEEISGEVPLLIEMKRLSGRAGEPSLSSFCSNIRAALEGYRGPVAVMSFDPRLIRWFREHAPTITRGLVATTHTGRKPANWRFSALWHLYLAMREKVDFVAYDIRSLPLWSAYWLRKRGCAILTWTVKSERAEQRARVNADGLIFERPLDPDPEWFASDELNTDPVLPSDPKKASTRFPGDDG
ncbi:MAG: glycerophosphodiester phosphodiesterase family protein [Pseudomonadota bacterium]